MPVPTTFGPCYDPRIDGPRLATQRQRLLGLLLEQPPERWLTLEEMRRALERRYGVRFPETSLSAQLRHLRKPAFGGWQVDKRRRCGGLWEYRLRPPRPVPQPLWLAVFGPRR